MEDWPGKEIRIGRLSPFYITSHHYGSPRRSYTPSSDRNTFVHLREKKATRGRVPSIACGARANKKNIFGCDFPQFHPARRFWFISPRPRHFTVGVDFLLLLFGWSCGPERNLSRVFLENTAWFCTIMVWAFWVDVDRN
jgi:hypothetical protein